MKTLQLTDKELEILLYHYRYDVETCCENKAWGDTVDSHTEEEAGQVLERLRKLKENN